MIPEAITRFIERFSRLPSIGPRLATRLAFYLAGCDAGTVNELSETVKALAALERCPRCFFLKQTGAPLCAICASPSRNRKVIAVVEKETDLLSIERTGGYRGTYFLLGDLPDRGTLSPKEEERIAALKRLIETEPGGKLDELIICLNPTSFGDFTAEALVRELKGKAARVTRLGRGIPTGGEIEFADEETLRNALEKRS